MSSTSQSQVLPNREQLLNLAEELLSAGRTLRENVESATTVSERQVIRGNKSVPAMDFCQTLHVNVDNPKLTDIEFRQFVRNTLPIVIYQDPNS